MITIDDLYLEDSGSFKCGKFSMIPYQHHKNKMIWKVYVILKQDTPHTDESNIFSEYTTVIAETARKAAFESIKQFKRIQETKSQCQEIVKEIKSLRKMERLNEKRNLQQVV